MSKTTLGLPYPWILKAHYIRGDRFFFFSVSPATLAFGFEFLRDGFVVLLGCMNIGWASISSFEKRAASGMEAPSGGETVKHGSTEGDSPTAESGDAQGLSA